MRRRILLVIVIGVVGVLAFWRWQLAGATETAVPTASLLPLLSEEDAAGFAQVTEPDVMRFPRDLGPHNDYQTEWWYYTGNLMDENGREFGYQLTFFRRALTPEAPESNNDWRTNQVYLAHFTISDIEAEQFYPHERFSRGSAGLAGAQAAPYKVWLEDWRAEEVSPGVVRLYAAADDVALDLTLTQTLPPVLHGDSGLSQKGPEPGNASYYYSLVQQRTQGSVQIGTEAYAVTGLSWKDHEYSTSALSAGSVGWDWFSLQLDNGTSLMFFQIRREDGTLEPFSSGSFISASGEVTSLDLADWELTVTDTWESPQSGAVYPSGWKIRVPSLELTLRGRPLMPNQELNVSTVYWEGAIAFTGTMAGEPVSARGYVELTGYAASMDGRI